jgi:hypothetical protein
MQIKSFNVYFFGGFTCGLHVVPKTVLPHKMISFPPPAVRKYLHLRHFDLISAHLNFIYPSTFSCLFFFTFLLSSFVYQISPFFLFPFNIFPPNDIHFTIYGIFCTLGINCNNKENFIFRFFPHLFSPLQNGCYQWRPSGSWCTHQEPGTQTGSRRPPGIAACHSLNKTKKQVRA